MIERGTARALALAVLMVFSVAAPFAMVATTTASSTAPSGLTAVPDSNVASDLPQNTPMGEAAQRLQEAGVYASQHSDSLEVVVTNPGRAKTKYSGGHLSGSGPVAIVFRDDTEHEGREVAVSAAVLEDVLGHRPGVAHGAHEDGTPWRSAIRYEAGYAVFEIPHFSENTVTFEGTVSIDAQPAQDGSEWSYDLDSLDSTANFTIDVTGSNATEWDNESMTAAVDGDSLSFNTGGTANARGPSNGNPVVTLTSGAPATQWSHSGNDESWGVGMNTSHTFYGDGSTLVALDQADGSTAWTHSTSGDIYDVVHDSGTVYFSTSDGNVVALDASTQTESWNVSLGSRPNALGTNSSHVVAGFNSGDVSALDKSDGSTDWTYTGHGSAVWGVDSNGTHMFSASLDGTARALDSSGSAVWTYNGPDGMHGLVTDGSNVYVGVANGEIRALDMSGTSQWWVAPHSGIVWDLSLNGGDLVSASNDNTMALIDTSAQTTRWTYSGHTAGVKGVVVGSEHFYSASADTTTDKVTYLTDSPSVAIDGTTVVSHSGRLRAGESATSEVTLSTGSHTADVSATSGVVDVSIEFEEVTETVDPTVTVNGYTTSYSGTLADGTTESLNTDTNWLQEGTNNVSVATSTSVGSDAPTGEVELAYSHDAIDNQSVTYEGEIFSERYTFSRTWSADQDAVSVEIPFDGNVIEIRELTKEVNDSGSPSDVSASNYSISNGTLVVDLGSVQKNTTIELDVVGSKVRPVNGSITVVEPTPLGADLASKIRIDSMQSDFHLEVNATEVGGNIHYVYSESWSNPQAYDRVEADGTSSLYFPNAAAGGTARIGTVPIELDPAGGYVDARVESAGSEPEFRFRDSTTASSVTVTFKDTQSGATYQLYNLGTDEEIDRATAQSPVEFTVDDPSGVRMIIYALGGGSEPVAGAGSSSSGLDLNVPIVMLGSVVALGLLLYLTRRFGDGSLTTTFVVGLGGVLVLLVAIQSFAPEIFTELIAEGIANAVPLIVLGGIALVVLWLRNGGNSESVILNIEGGNK